MLISMSNSSQFKKRIVDFGFYQSLKELVQVLKIKNYFQKVHTHLGFSNVLTKVIIGFNL
jgi:hypothetical protein